MARNLRNETLAGGGFFAFQDIITTVIAVIVLFMLILIAGDRGVFQTSENAKASASAADSPKKKELDAKLAKIAKLEGELAAKLRTAGHGATIAGGVHPEVLAEKEAVVAERRKRLAEVIMQEKKITRDIKTEIQKKTAALAEKENLEKKLDSLQKANEDSEKKALEEEKTEREMASKAKETIRRSKETLVIPEKTRTSKKPVFGVVMRDRVRWSLYGRESGISESEGNELPRSALSSLSGFVPRDYYVVLYFKPSGARHFENLRLALKQAGYEVGYDAVEEDAELSFNPPEENN
jgi:hypothetical protein